MGAFVQGRIPTLFHGVSTQPENSRIPGQLNDALNLSLTVETGGFEKRPPMRLRTLLSGLGTDWRSAHVINRDPTEQYVVLHRAGDLRVYSLINMAQQTVNAIPAPIQTYLTGDIERDFVFVTVADYTLILNRRIVTAMDAFLVAAPPKVATLTVLQSVAGATVVTVNGTLVSTTTVIASDTVATTAGKIRTDLIAALGAGWTVTADSNYVFVRKVDGSDFTINLTDQGGYTTVVKDSVASTANLPARCLNDTIYKVDSTSTDGYYVRFVAEGATNRGLWRETVAPSTQGRLDRTKQPHALVRNPDSTWTVQTLDWKDRVAGDAATVPNPEFIGSTIADLVFHRNRLFLLSDENASASQAGDFFNFWPDYSTQVLDSDPFGLVATTNEVSLLNFAIPFRKSLFLTATSAQFEISGQTLTPKSASIELSTSYNVSSRARPVALGDTLFIAQDTPGGAAILEYVYDDATITNTADDVVRHAKGFVPTDVVRMVGDAVTGNLVILSDRARTSLFIHTYLWQGDKKVQAAWHRWQLPLTRIHAIAMIDARLIVVGSLGTSLAIGEIDMSRPAWPDYPFTPALDLLTEATGTYDPVLDVTTFNLPIPVHDQPRFQAVPAAAYGPVGLPIVTTDAGFPNRAILIGDWSAHKVAFGYTYDSQADLSRLFLRNEDQSAIVAGRLQLRRMRLAYQKTGYFETVVRSDGRDDAVRVFTGRLVGRVENLANVQPTTSGVFQFRVGSHNETCRIIVRNPSVFPFSITNAEWDGFYNDTVKQG
jgi:hypothetical protein